MIVTSVVGVALALSAIMALAWWVQYRTRNSGWADVFWSYEMGLGGAYLALVHWHGAAHAPSPRQWLVAILVGLWSVRLGTHILRRTLRATSEDPRYAELRQQWKDNFQPRLFWFLQVQALAAFVLVLSVGIAAHNPAPGIRATDVIGALVLLGAIFGEGAADQQLKQFAANKANKGRVCDIGLWAWSRHPNYFFEWLGWLAYPIIATNVFGSYPWGYLALSGPLFMFVLLRYVSGVPPLEAHMVRKHGGNYRAYQEKVSAFFPAPPPASGEAPPVGLIPAAIGAIERLPIPDALTRAGIGALVGRTRRRLAVPDPAGERAFAEGMAAYPIAEHAEAANAQHYEVPAEFFGLCLGPRRKYSCCYYDAPATTLAEAEGRALALTCTHAALADGQSILELGCGWGSLTLWMAEHFPNAAITAVSNSHSQRAYILGEAARRGLGNIDVVTADMNAFATDVRHDRIVSVEMFEHMANWRALLERTRGWLADDGRLFVHVFTHANAPYRFDHRDAADWIARHFFTGGIMPSRGLMRQFGDLYEVVETWDWNGTHYARTARDWLANCDANRVTIAKLFAGVYGRDTKLWLRRWRLFYLATEGLFGHAGGEAWGVTHYLMRKAG